MRESRTSGSVRGDRGNPVPYRDNGNGGRHPWPGWVFQGSGDLPRCLRSCWLGNRRAAGAGQLRSAPVHRSESSTGYSSAGCSPAEPASASPVTENGSSIVIRRGDQMRCSTSLQGSNPVIASAAKGVSSLLCTPGDLIR